MCVCGRTTWLLGMLLLTGFTAGALVRRGHVPNSLGPEPDY